MGECTRRHACICMAKKQRSHGPSRAHPHPLFSPAFDPRACQRASATHSHTVTPATPFLPKALGRSTPSGSVVCNRCAVCTAQTRVREQDAREPGNAEEALEKALCSLLLHDAGPCQDSHQGPGSRRQARQGISAVSPLCYQGLIRESKGLFSRIRGGEPRWRWRRCGDGVGGGGGQFIRVVFVRRHCTRTMLGNPDPCLHPFSISRCHCHHGHESMARRADHDRVLKHRNTQLIKTSVFAHFSVDRKASRHRNRLEDDEEKKTTSGRSSTCQPRFHETLVMV
jgi:hypothetical protein